MLHSPLSRRPLPFPVKRIEDRHRFSTLAVCHALIRPIALLNSCLLIDSTAMTHLPGPQNPGECHLYVAEGCHLYIAATPPSRIKSTYVKWVPHRVRLAPCPTRVSRHNHDPDYVL